MNENRENAPDVISVLMSEYEDLVCEMNKCFEEDERKK